MKKIITMTLVLLLCISAVLMTGCSGSKQISYPYEEYNLDEYIKLPDYSKYDITPKAVEVTDEDLQIQIDYILKQSGTTEKVTEGTVEKGDTVNISFKGTLEDGTTNQGMQSDSYRLTLGSGGMINGFEDGLYGATIGQPVTLDLKFPDPYSNSPDLAGKGVTFEVTVLNKEVSVPAELNDEFVQKNSEFKTVEEYKADLKKNYIAYLENQSLQQLQKDIYSKLLEETEILKYPEGQVDAEVSAVRALEEEAAKAQNLEFENFVKQYYGVEMEEYEKNLKEVGQSMVEAKMIFCKIAQKDEVKITEKMYKEELNKLMMSQGAKDEKSFKESKGMTIEEYADKIDYKTSVLVQKVLDKLCKVDEEKTN